MFMQYILSRNTYASACICSSHFDECASRHLHMLIQPQQAKLPLPLAIHATVGFRLLEAVLAPHKQAAGIEHMEISFSKAID